MDNQGVIDWEQVVAPFAGAWIEISGWRRNSGAGKSLPSRERGLKFSGIQRCAPEDASLPSRERGLKFGYIVILLKVYSRSLRGSVD